MIEIVLLQDVPKLGKRGEVKQVKDGYAVNYLFPKGLARRATEQDKIRAKALSKQGNKRLSEVFAELEHIVKQKVKGLIFEAPATKAGSLYASIKPEAVLEKIFEMAPQLKGFKHIRMNLSAPIKKVGRYVVELVVEFNGKEKKVPVIVDVVAEGGPRLKSKTL